MVCYSLKRPEMGETEANLWKEKDALPYPKYLLSLTFWHNNKGQLMLCEWQAKSHIPKNDIWWAEKDNPNHVLWAELRKPYWRQLYHSKHKFSSQLHVTKLLPIICLQKVLCKNCKGLLITAAVTNISSWAALKKPVLGAQKCKGKCHDFVSCIHTFIFLSRYWDAEHGVISTHLVKLWRKKS